MKAKGPPMSDFSARDLSASTTLLAGVQIFGRVPVPFRATNRWPEGSEQWESRQKDLRQKKENPSH